MDTHSLSQPVIAYISCSDSPLISKAIFHRLKCLSLTTVSGGERSSDSRFFSKSNNVSFYSGSLEFSATQHFSLIFHHLQFSLHHLPWEGLHPPPKPFLFKSTSANRGSQNKFTAWKLRFRVGFSSSGVRFQRRNFHNLRLQPHLGPSGPRFFYFLHWYCHCAEG